MRKGTIPSIFAASQGAFSSGRNLIDLTDSFKDGDRKSLLFNFGLAPVLSKLSAVNKASDETPIKVLTR